MSRTAVSIIPHEEPPNSDETVRCYECRQVWPRTAMRWGHRATGPAWLAPSVRVLRCPDCLPG